MTTHSVVLGGTMTVDGGPTLRAREMNIEGPELIHENCQVPNPNWVFTDAAGHEHRWWRRAHDDRTGRRRGEPELPTLVRSMRHMECDGSCGGICEGQGYHVPVHHCRECGAEVEPGRREGTVAFETSPAQWFIDTEGAGDVADDAAVTLNWPSGPGQMSRMTGTVREVSTDVQVWPRPKTVERQFLFVPAQS